MIFDSFYVGLFVVLAIIAGAAYVWERGLLGTATEARIKAIKAKVLAWEAKREAKAAPAKDKATRIAENAALLAAGTITQAEADAARAKILAE